MTDYQEKYIKMKKKYLKLKNLKKLQMQQGGGTTIFQPSYLNFLPTDGAINDSDKEMREMYLNKVNENKFSDNGNVFERLEKTLDMADIKDTEAILNLK